MHLMQPLLDVTGCMRFPGWVWNIMGSLYCLTIAGAIVGWLPIWMGVLLNKAVNRLQSGFASGSNGELGEASRSLSTIFVIVAVLTGLSVALSVAYLLFVLGMFFLFATSAMQG